jgi:FdhD protein
MRNSAEQFPVRKVTPTETVDTGDMLAVEEPLEIRLVSGPEGSRAEKSISITMRTPGHDEELAAGFLFTEGVIRDAGEINTVTTSDTANVLTVHLNPGLTPAFATLDRNFYTTSSCGVCGKASLDAVKTKSVFHPGQSNLKVTSALLHSLQEKLRGHQKVFDVTGGLHASALFDRSGNLMLVREDVGRHNALDKVIGASLRNNELPLDNSILLLSGRISFELVQKAYMAGIPFIAAIGAPSTLAVTMAEECGMTLVGFLRDNRYTVYSGKQRIS